MEKIIKEKISADHLLYVSLKYTKTCDVIINLLLRWKIMIDIGIDIINPVQTSARDMDPVQLKKQFGNQIVFWGGGIDSQHVLPFAKPDQVKKEVHHSLDIFKPGGGYVFNNIHNIQSGVPAENIIAMYEAAYEFGFYNKPANNE